MNLLRRRVEMPRVIWEDSRLTADEKILLSVVYSLNDGKWTAISWGDVIQTLGVKRAFAVNLIESLSAGDSLEVARSTGGRLRMRLGRRYSEAVARERMARGTKLMLCFIQCNCGYDLRMDFIEQIRICPDCRRVVYYTPEDKVYLAQRG